MRTLRGAQFMLDSMFETPREDTDDLLLELLPRTNLVRLVMIHWCSSPAQSVAVHVKLAAACAQG